MDRVLFTSLHFIYFGLQLELFLLTSFLFLFLFFFINFFTSSSSSSTLLLHLVLGPVLVLHVLNVVPPPTPSNLGIILKASYRVCS
ncbi:hypothetical protein C5167_031692 [Papaver somniferum]|uniref:Uncharacterized protein n=1 Tax=Papaver somniferum TaxID=3469 RepID=A0A4Y7K6L2_PAPSO|nr:hypothetical protein C5167_031692 [Papaver somniferum]